MSGIALCREDSMIEPFDDDSDDGDGRHSEHFSPSEQANAKKFFTAQFKLRRAVSAVN